jgi:hypothetical protein
MLKYLFDHIGHALTARVVQQCPLVPRCIGHDHDRPAFHLQSADGSEFVRIVEEKKSFTKDRAQSILTGALGREIRRIFQERADDNPPG